jgi:hypothetical protein
MKCNKDNDVLDSHFKSVVMSADEMNGSLAVADVADGCGQ